MSKSVGPRNIEAVHAHLRKGGKVMLIGCYKPLVLSKPEQISAEGDGYRVPGGPRSKKTVFAFAHQVVWL